MRRRLLAFPLGFFPQYLANLKSASIVAHVRQLTDGGGGS